MTTLDRNRTVAQLVIDHPALARVFQDHHVDYCCGGTATVEEAAAELGLDAPGLWRALEAAAARKVEPGQDVAALGTPQLVAHIVERHHAFLRRALPPVGAMSSKVARVHGDHDPRLVDLDDEFQSLSRMLLAHLDQEEEELFPRLLSSTVDPERLRRDLVEMKAEHVEVGQSLDRLRQLSDQHSVPEWGCATYRALMEGLRSIQDDIFTHVHLENHVLAPRVAG